jgi:hypothetical protein
MKLGSLQSIPLASAYLCPDCNLIGNCSRQCPACASAVLIGLACVLDRETGKVSKISYLPRPALAA